MNIELKPCSKCGGKWRLYDFDHTYNPKNKSIKFLNNGNGLTTAAECCNCGRSTKHFNLPIDAINSWNEGEIYNGKEYGDKLAREYTGKIYSEEEIREHIMQTNWNIYGVEIYFTNGSSQRIYIDEYEPKYILPYMDTIIEKDINKIISIIFNFIKERNLKVKELEYIKDK